jgi:lysine 2,3-aminomutase
MVSLRVVDDVVDADTDVGDADDAAWRDQLKRAARSARDLADAGLALSDDEAAAGAHLEAHGGLPLGVTPHFLSLIDKGDPADPLRRQVIPRAAEFAPTSWDRRDPLGEEDLEVVPFLVHRYPDRVLLLATDRCAAYCRFCTRKRLVGQGPTPSWEHLEAAFQYIAEHQEIKEVIVSGGDVALLSDDRVARLLSRLRCIGHLDVIRVASRVLAFLPQRVTPSLVALLRNHDLDGPTTYWLSHFNHEKEVTAPAATRAIAALVDGGVPVLNQTVLLKGVNDDRDALLALFRALTKRRARPYYLHQCDLAPGTDHFRVALDDARALYASLRGHLSGISLPSFVVDLPGGKGKQPLSYDPVVGGDDDSVILKGYRGDLVAYPRR